MIQPDPLYPNGETAIHEMNPIEFIKEDVFPPDVVNKIIFDLDLDYFFEEVESESKIRDNYLDDLEFLKLWYSIYKDNISVVTIALSPEFCGDSENWDNSKCILREVLEIFEIEYNFKNIFGK